jgi:hypothetical protein
MADEKSDSLKVRAAGRAVEGEMDRTQPRPPNRKTKAPPAQDRWFDTQLSRMYADLAADPLPKEMVSLLEKLKKTER